LSLSQVEERFTAMLEDIKNEHNSVQANIARGLQELSETRSDIERKRGVLLHEGMPFDFGQVCWVPGARAPAAPGGWRLAAGG